VTGREWSPCRIGSFRPCERGSFLRMIMSELPRTLSAPSSRRYRAPRRTPPS
jgi:hypothetical protein